MLSRLLGLFPSVRDARDLAVAHERLACAEARVLELRTELRALDADRLALQRRLDRLIDARLLKDGAIGAPVLADPPTSTRASVPSAFGTIGRMVYLGEPASHPPFAPVGDDVAG